MKTNAPLYLLLAFFFFFSAHAQAQCDAVYADNNVVLASVSKKLYRSTDGGNTFQHILLAGEDNVEVRCITKVNNTLIAGGINGFIRVFRSTDNGLTWTAANAGMPQIGSSHVAVPVAALGSGSRVFMGGTNFAKYSDNEGQSWTDIPTVPGSMMLAVKSVNGKLWLSSGQQVRSSTDNGTTWTQTAANPFFGGASAVGYAEFGSKLVVLGMLGAGQAVKQSLNNGASWQTIGSLSGGLDMIRMGNTLYAAAQEGFMKSTDEGQTWTNTCSTFQYYQYGGKMAPHNNHIWIASMNGLVKYDTASGTCSLVNLSAQSIASENSPTHAVQVYPNPATDRIHIARLHGASIISIYEWSGKKVHSEETDLPQISISTRHLPAGLYTLTVQSAAHTARHKLLIAADR